MSTWMRLGSLMLLLGSRAAAEGHQGTLGEQSRATIRISVSVAPRFILPANSRPRDINPRGLALVSNAPAIRLSVKRADDDSASSQSKEGQGARNRESRALLLVVPD